MSVKNIGDPPRRRVASRGYFPSSQPWGTSVHQIEMEVLRLQWLPLMHPKSIGAVVGVWPTGPEIVLSRCPT
jgi:hypothetical protein